MERKSFQNLAGKICIVILLQLLCQVGQIYQQQFHKAESTFMMIYNLKSLKSLKIIQNFMKVQRFRTRTDQVFLAGMVKVVVLFSGTSSTKLGLLMCRLISVSMTTAYAPNFIKKLFWKQSEVNYHFNKRFRVNLVRYFDFKKFN